MNISIFNLAWQSAEKIFLNPSVLYKYEDIIKGVTVNGIRKKSCRHKHYTSIWEKA